MKMINSLISIIVLIVMLVSPQGNVSAADILTWENRQDMPTPRYSMGAAVSGGIIYAVGGDNYSCTPLNNVEEFDPDTDTWNIRKSMPTGRGALGTATAPDGKIYAIGGSTVGNVPLATVEEYTPEGWPFSVFTSRRAGIPKSSLWN